MLMKKGQVIIGPRLDTRYRVVASSGFGGEVKIENEETGITSYWFDKTLLDLGYTIEDSNGDNDETGS